MTTQGVQQLGQGFFWQDLAVGRRFRTHRRTITESDLVGFIGVTGMLEKIFIDATPMPGGISGRPVPALLTTAIVEGFIFQTMIQGTGLALLETTKGNRAIVDSTITVLNQDEETVLIYTARRMLAGRE